MAYSGCLAFSEGVEIDHGGRFHPFHLEVLVGSICDSAPAKLNQCGFNPVAYRKNHIEYIIEGTDYYWHDQNSWSARPGGLSRRWSDLSRFTYDLGFQVYSSVHCWRLYEAYTHDVGHSYVGHIIQVHACTNAGACYPFNYSVFQFVILSARLLLHVYIFFKNCLSVHCYHPNLFVRYWWWPKEIIIISMCNSTV